MVKISCLILTYNPNLDELLETIHSCTIQKYGSFEIVVSDDGSKNDYFPEVIKYFDEIGYENYKLVKSEKNNGTVLNLSKGLCECKGEWIKFLSPGDYLVGEYCLKKWINFLSSKSCEWAFSKAYYYRFKKNQLTDDVYVCYPQQPDVYLQSGKKSVFSYLICNNIGIGATFICKKDLLDKYLPMIVGQIIYTEDVIFKLMMFCGDIGAFFDEKMIFYSLGEGISTGGDSIWGEKLQNDADKFSRIIEHLQAKDFCSWKIKKMIWTDRLKNRRLAAIIKIVLSPTFARYFYKLRYHKRYEKVLSFEECMKMGLVSYKAEG